MRQGPNGRRPRGRPNRKQHGGPSRPNSFDSGGPEGRIRGNAHQVYEKYLALARDAVSAGDRVSAETYYQHAEHYFRIVNSSTDPEPGDRRPPRGDAGGHDGNGRDGDGRTDDRHDAISRDSGGRPRHERDAGTQDAENAAPSRTGEPGERTPNRNPNRTPGNGEPANIDLAAPASAPQPATPRKPGEDREGLDRVLGGEGRPAHRPRQRPSRPPEAGMPASSGAPPARRGNGQARDATADRGAARGPRGEQAPEAPSPRPDEPPAEQADAGAPGAKNTDTEPAGS